MFFCEDCRIQNGWPEGASRSLGRCEDCGMETSCHDVPSSHLPSSHLPARSITPPRQKKERKKKERPTPKFMLVTYAGETEIEKFDNEDKLLARWADLRGGGVGCEAYEVQPIELELFARRKTPWQTE